MNALVKGWRATGVQEKLHILIQGTLIILFFILMQWVLDQFEAFCTVTQSVSQSIAVTVEVWDASGQRLK